MLQALLQPEVGQVVATQFVAQKRQEFFVLPQKRVLEVGAEDVMAMLDLGQRGV